MSFCAWHRLDSRHINIVFVRNLGKRLERDWAQAPFSIAILYSESTGSPRVPAMALLAETLRTPEDLARLRRVLQAETHLSARPRLVGVALRHLRSPEFIREIVAAGALVNELDDSGDSPLTWLLKWAGGPSTLHQDPMSFHVARDNRCARLALVLLSAGALVLPSVSLIPGEANDNIRESPCAKVVREYSDALLSTCLLKAVDSAALPREWQLIAQYIWMPSMKKRSLRGINIQWPFSQLILEGLKTIECRKYPLGHHKFAWPGEELWLIETPGPPSNCRRSRLPTESLKPRPVAAQVVGIVKFDNDKPYQRIEDFRLDENRHQIQRGSSYDWNGLGNMYAWKVVVVSFLKTPVLAGAKQIIGWSKPRQIQIGESIEVASSSLSEA